MIKFKDRLFLPPTRILTYSRISAVLVGLFLLTAYAQADVAFNGTTFTGSGEYDQSAGSAEEPLTANLFVTADADGSTITLSGGVYTTGNLTHNKGILTIASGTTNSVNKFQIQKAGANGTTAYLNGVVNANSLTVNGTEKCTSHLNISGELNVSGTVTFNGDAYGQGILNQTGGTVNFTTTVDKATSTTEGICIGLYETDASYPACYNLSDGTFNAPNATVYVGWNGPGELNISGGEANLKGIQLVGGWNSTTGYAAAAKGTINLTGGKLNIGANGITLKNSRHEINLGDGTIGAIESHTWASTLTATLTSGKTPTFDIDSGKTITIDSLITGEGSLKKTGAGTLTLTQTPGYTGSTTIEAGTLVLSAGGTLYNLTGAASTTLDTNGNSVTLNNSSATVFSGVITGSGSVTKTGSETLTFNSTSNNSIASNLVIDNGTVILANKIDERNRFTGTVTVNAGGTLQTNAQDSVGYANGATTFNLYGGTLYINGYNETFQNKTVNLIGGTIVSKDANSSLHIFRNGTNFNVYANDGASADKPTISYVNGWVRLRNTEDFNITVAENAKLVFNTGNIDQGNEATKPIVKLGNGVMAFETRNAYRVGTTISEGTLELVAQDAIATSGSVINNAAIIMEAAQTLNNLSGNGTINNGGYALTLNNTSSTEFTGIISGDGSVTKTGSGALTIAANANGQPYTGGTTVSAGTLYLKGTNNGKSSVGTGDLTINSGAIVEAQSSNVLGHTSADNIPHVIINGGTLKPRQYLHMKSVELNSGTITASTVSGGTGLDFNNRNGVITSTGSSSIASPIVNTSTLTINVKDGTLSLTGTINNGSAYKTIKTGSGTLTTSNWINNIVELQEGTLEITGNFGNNKRFNGEVTIAKGATLLCAAKDTLGYGTANTKLNIYGLMDSTVDNETLNNTELHMYGGTAQSSSGSTFDILNTGVKFFSYALEDATADAPTVSTISSTILFRTNGTFAIDTAENSQLNLSGSIQNLYNNTRYNCTIAKTGEGTLVLSGANTHTNPTSISAGTLQLTGDAVVANGPITVGDNGTLDFNLSSGQSKLLTITNDNKITSTGQVVKTGAGTLQINAAQGAVDVNSMIVSSGRLDMKEYFKGNLEINKDATFSPGNSVGTLNIDGKFVLNSGAALLIEQDATGMDLLIADSFNIASDSILELTVGSVQPGAKYAIIQDSDSELIGVDFWNSILTPESSYYWNLSVDGNTLYATLDANAVPEPSTWALLVLGVVALFLRKRVRS